MPKLTPIISVLGLFFGSVTYPALSGQTQASIVKYKPSWRVGQTWEVEVSKMSEPPAHATATPPPFHPNIVNYVYQFQIEKKVVESGENRYQVRIECISMDGKKVNEEWFYRAFFRDDNFTLASIQRLSKTKQKVDAFQFFSVGAILATDWVGFLPFDFPFFEAPDGIYNPVVTKSKDGNIVHFESNHAQQVSKEVQDRRVGVTGNMLIIELSGKDFDSTRTTQEWSEGLPWWVSSVYERNGKEWSRARLITVDGKVISK